MGTRGRLRPVRVRRTVAAVCAVLATSALLSGCFDTDFGGGDMAVINDDGVAVGMIRVRDEVGNVRTETVAIDTESGDRTVFAPPGGWPYTMPTPTGLADDGMVIAVAAQGFLPVGLRWWPATGEVELAPQGQFEATFLGTVSDGGIAGGYGRDGDAVTPILWDGDEVVDLSAVPGAPVAKLGNAQVVAVNDHRQVVGRAIFDGVLHLFTWDAATGFRFRPYEDGQLSAINDDGVIVGSTFDAGIGQYRQAWYDWATLTPHPLDELGLLREVNDRNMAVGTAIRFEDGTAVGYEVCADLTAGSVTDLRDGKGYFAADLNDAGAVVGNGSSRAGMWNPGTCVPSSG